MYKKQETVKKQICINMKTFLISKVNKNKKRQKDFWINGGNAESIKMCRVSVFGQQDDTVTEKPHVQADVKPLSQQTSSLLMLL